MEKNNEARGDRISFKGAAREYRTSVERLRKAAALGQLNTVVYGNRHELIRSEVEKLLGREVCE